MKLATCHSAFSPAIAFTAASSSSSSSSYPGRAALSCSSVKPAVWAVMENDGPGEIVSTGSGITRERGGGRRRHLLLLSSPCFCWPWLLVDSSAKALVEKAPPPDYPPKSALIQQLLEKSRANKSKNDQQRLDSYYERNFKDYFEFVEGYWMYDMAPRLEYGISHGFSWMGKLETMDDWIYLAKNLEGPKSLII